MNQQVFFVSGLIIIFTGEFQFQWPNGTKLNKKQCGFICMRCPFLFQFRTLSILFQWFPIPPQTLSMTLAADILFFTNMHNEMRRHRKIATSMPTPIKICRVVSSVKSFNVYSVKSFKLKWMQIKLYWRNLYILWTTYLLLITVSVKVSIDSPKLSNKSTGPASVVSMSISSQR